MVSALMELTNRLMRLRGTEVAARPAWDESVRLLLLMLAPIAPHISRRAVVARAGSAPARSGARSMSRPGPTFDPALVAATRSNCRSRSTASCATS